MLVSLYEFIAINVVKLKKETNPDNTIIVRIRY